MPKNHNESAKEKINSFCYNTHHIYEDRKSSDYIKRSPQIK
jgi:hypothetical protein